MGRGYGARAGVATDGGRRFLQRDARCARCQRGLRARLRAEEEPPAAFGQRDLAAGSASARAWRCVAIFVLSMGGLDESFGPGARFPSADEWDICMRALLSGAHVYETAGSCSILHDGFRTFAEGRQHARRDWIALGAVCAKPLRAGHFRAAVVPVWLFSTRAVFPPIVDLLHFSEAAWRRAKSWLSYTRRFAAGLGTEVDRATLRFF